jgi:hypothetical protein
VPYRAVRAANLMEVQAMDQPDPLLPPAGQRHSRRTVLRGLAAVTAGVGLGVGRAGPGVNVAPGSVVPEVL